MLKPKLGAASTTAFEFIKRAVAEHGISTEWEFKYHDPSRIFYWTHEKGEKRLRLNIKPVSYTNNEVTFTLMVELSTSGTFVEDPRLNTAIVGVFTGFTDQGMYHATIRHKGARIPVFRPFWEIKSRKTPLSQKDADMLFEIDCQQWESWIQKLLNGFSVFKL